MKPPTTPLDHRAPGGGGSLLFGWMASYCYACAYILSFHAAYLVYINPTFQYAGYNYVRFTTVALVTTYFLAWVPMLAYRSTGRPVPAQATVALIYTLCYVPIQLSLLFSVERSYDRLFWVQAMLAVSMIVLFLAAKDRGVRKQPGVVRFRAMDSMVVAVSLLAVAVMVTVNRGHMRFISFEDVYDLRFEAAAATGRSFLSDYLTSWLIYCLTSYLFARALVYRKWSLLLVGLAGGVLIYMCEGHKSAILLLPMTLGLSWLWGSGKQFLPKLLLVMATLIMVVSFAIPDEGVSPWIKAILLIRVVGSGGWLATKYLEFFPAEGLTYYSHITPIKFITGIYPFGDLSLGQMIGLAYSGTIQANHNASFWASEGFAALGPIGILVVTPMVAGLLYAINRIMANLDPKFTVLWMCGFFVALLNVPLFTALLSGGGGIIFAQAWWISRPDRTQRLRVISPVGNQPDGTANTMRKVLPGRGQTTQDRPPFVRSC